MPRNQHIRNFVIATMIALPLTGTAQSAQSSGSTGEPIYGSQLMNKQERDQYRQRMREAQTPQERDRIRQEHHAQMKERARAQGKTLPDSPPPRGKGKGWGPGHGKGYGQGGGGTGPGGAGSAPGK